MNKFLCDGRVGAQEEAEAAAALAQGPAGGEVLSHKDGAGCSHPAHVATSSQGWLLEKGSPLNSLAEEGLYAFRPCSVISPPQTPLVKGISV